MRLSALFAVLAVLDTCPGTGPTGPLREGTWGGENAGVIVTGDVMHVHVGCTYGDAPVPQVEDGRFVIMGRHNVSAHPVDLGIYHPARFEGRVSGTLLTLTVTLTDTAASLGPVRVAYGVEPRMGPCPICRAPELDRRTRTN